MGGDEKINNHEVITVTISIHTTRVGGDQELIKAKFSTQNFNPHHPCGWWRPKAVIASVTISISIHTTRVGGDFLIWLVTTYQSDFNPHHPCGWWPYNNIVFLTCRNFNPHHPCGWWRVLQGIIDDIQKISIHTTRVGGDFLAFLFSIISKSISIHTTRVGGDLDVGYWEQVSGWFQSTPPVWVVTLC